MTTRYRESTKQEVLDPLISASSCLLVPGAYFGDEGKGKTVDAVAQHEGVTVVARVNSGENAGHTVIGPAPECHKYDFHLCPSGLLTPGACAGGRLGGWLGGYREALSGLEMAGHLPTNARS